LFSPGQGLVEHILMISHGIMVGIMWKERRSDAWWKDGQSCQRLKKKGKKKRKRKKIKKERKKCSIMFLRFYVEKAWNQKKLSIGD